MGDYVVPLKLYTGSDFSYDFFLANPDKSAFDDMSNFTFFGFIAKHPGALFVNDSTSDTTYWNYIPITCTISNALEGILNIQVSENLTSTLEEGKYEYTINMVDPNGNTHPRIISGTMFVVSGMTAQNGFIGPKVN